MTFDSLPTVEDANLEKYWDIVRRLDPEFYLIRIALKETAVNLMLIPKIVRAINNLNLGTGYGKVQIFMSNHKITQIKTEESDQVEEMASFDSGSKPM